MPSSFHPIVAERRLQLFVGAVLLVISAIFFAGYLRFLLDPASGYNDFFVFWAAARHLQQAPLAGVYDQAGFEAFKLTLTDGHFSQLPFLYPPYSAFLFMPFGYLPFRAGLLLWDGLSMACYLLALWLVLRPRGAISVAALIAPATVATLLAGQTGLLTSALALLGLHLLEKRPAVAGILLGLLTLKPQIALLPCLILLTSGRHRACLAAVLTVAALALGSALAFGLDAWAGWIACLRDFATGLDHSGSHQQFGVTVYFTLLSLGFEKHLALLVQILSTLLVLGIVTHKLRRAPAVSQTMLILVGMYLATPYASVYDLPAISAVCLMLLIEGRRDGFRSGELLAISLAWCMPMLLVLLSARMQGLALAVLAGLFLLLLRRSNMAQPHLPAPA